MKTHTERSKRPRPYLKTGVFGVKRALKERGIKALDGRTTAARAIREWRAACEADLGGAATLSRMEHTILDASTSAVFLLGMIDAWIGARPELIVNTRKRSVAPVVRERIAVADHLARLLGQLGLKRRAREVPALADYVRAKVKPQAPPDAASAEPLPAVAQSDGAPK